MTKGKTAAKSAGATKAAAEGTPAKKAAAKKAPAKPVAKKSAAKKPAAKKASAKKPAAKGADNYTKPELREKIKAEIVAGDKGGKPGQWSARKAQMVAHEYEAEGGGYKHERTETQEHLKQWGDEKWHTADGKPAIREGKDGEEETHRYLPDEAWKELSPAEKKATDRKKVAGSKRGKQFVANTPEASEARKHAEEHGGKK